MLLAIIVTACAAATEPADTPDVNNASTASEINTATEQASTAEVQAPAETAAPEETPTPKEPQLNRRVEVPDDLVVNWLIPWDGILPIYEPEFTTAEKAPLEDDELVIAAAWVGEAKAFLHFISGLTPKIFLFSPSIQAVA